MRKFIAAAIVAAALAIPATASATSAESNASPCGAVHAARADVNGNFGSLGEEGGTPGHHGGLVGQEHNETDGATGYNNSHTDCQA